MDKWNIFARNYDKKNIAFIVKGGNPGVLDIEINAWSWCFVNIQTNLIIIGYALKSVVCGKWKANQRIKKLQISKIKRLSIKCKSANFGYRYQAIEIMSIQHISSQFWLQITWGWIKTYLLYLKPKSIGSSSESSSLQIVNPIQHISRLIRIISGRLVWSRIPVVWGGSITNSNTKQCSWITTIFLLSIKSQNIKI